MVARYDHEQWARAQMREEQRQLRAEAAAEKAAGRERKAEDAAAGRAKAEQLNGELARRIDRPRLRYLVQQYLNKDVLVAPPVGRARTWEPPVDKIGG